MIKGVTHAHLGLIWHHSEPSDVPYSPNQFLALDFFCHFLQQHCSSCCLFNTVTYEGFWDILQQDKLSKIKRTLIPLDFFFHISKHN